MGGALLSGWRWRDDRGAAGAAGVAHGAAAPGHSARARCAGARGAMRRTGATGGGVNPPKTGYGGLRGAGGLS